MSNTPVKTGGWCHLPEYNCWVYGDIYETKGGDVVVRVIRDVADNTTYNDPGEPVTWAVIDNVDLEFCDGRMKTLIGRGKIRYRWEYMGGQMVAVEQ